MDDYTQNYAKYYDVLTRHKDYEQEVEILTKFLGSEGFDSSTKVLSVGCGIAAHEKLLAAQFTRVVGIDKSSHMIQYGKLKNSHENLVLSDASLETLEERDFGVVVSLFNVANCIGSIESLKSFFQQISSKLVDGGLVVFEIWNATETILFPPKVVERTYDEGEISLKRVATPYLDKHRGFLKLEYDITGQDQGKSVELNSVHDIYLYPERVVEYCLREASFESISWYSALSEGMNPAVDSDRMLLCCARK